MSLLTNLFLQIQFLWSKYCPGLPRITLTFASTWIPRVPFSTIYYTRKIFQICLLLHTDEFNLHTHLQLSCHNTLQVSFNLIKKL